MNKRPNAVTVLSWVFITAGVVGLAYHFTGFKAQPPFQYDILWVALVRLLAIVCGVYMLRGRNWARWLTLVWIAYHVALSAFHSLNELVVHTLFFVVFAYILFRPGATEYFRGTRTEAT
jgi:hypothetical protein